MRILLGLCVALLLGGCNRIVTERPLFVANASPDAPGLRDGLWLFETPPGVDVGKGKPCKVDTRKPATRWPDCATWGLVRGGEWLSYDDGPGERKWESAAFVLGGPGPSVLQLVDVDSGDGSIKYEYVGIETSRAGADGRIEGIVFWYALCGPPPPEGTKGADGETRYVTLNPFPGLTIAGNNCTTDSPDAVVASAKASYGIAPGGAARWIRDTYP